MNLFTKLVVLYAFLAGFTLSAQTNRVLVSVDWPDLSHENKVEVYDPANNLLVTLCNSELCYATTGTTRAYSVTYDMGCLPINVSNYYIKIYDANNNGWDGTSNVTVNVAGTDVITNDGSTADTTGVQINFTANDLFNLCSDIDTDGDGVINTIDLDDDNDGILDAAEGLGIDPFACAIPELNFFGGYYDAAASSGAAEGTVGSVYRFPNASALYDVLVEVVLLDNASISLIDDDVVDNPNYFQSTLTFNGAGSPGIEFKFTIVDLGTTTPSASLLRIGGTAWDMDGQPDAHESVIYYNPSAYGVDNPTSLITTDLGGGAIQLEANGTMEGAGFSTLPELRSYFQFNGNSFNIRMQYLKTTTSTNSRNFGLSFTQCDIFDYNAPVLTIVNGFDTDLDGYDNHLDIDSDNDGIPDNVEAQPTTGYIVPNHIFDPISGIDTAYSSLASYTDTDSDGILDYIDSDSDNDGTPDIEENGLANSVTPADSDNDGLKNVFETTLVNDFVWDVNEDIENPSDLSILPDTDSDLAFGGDLDYRDVLDAFFTNAALDFDGIDDYVEIPTSVINGLSEYTVSLWFKYNGPALDTDDDVFVMGQKEVFEVSVGNWSTAFNPTYNAIQGKAYRNNSSFSGVASGWKFNKSNWTNVTVVVKQNGANVEAKVYRNGFASATPGSLPGTLSNNSNPLRLGIPNGTHNFEYNFNGWMDEVRIFNKALTDDQVKYMTFQEIENVGGYVHGSVIDKDIIDSVTNAKIPWSSVIAYYPMSDITGAKLTDMSLNNNTASMYNMTTLQDQTAPMPFETVSDGDWTSEGTWLHGDVWDIENLPDFTPVSQSHEPWSIVQIHHDVTTSKSHTGIGLIIDSDKTLTVNGNNAITNSWYLQLDGTLDLKDDSQLVQDSNSDLVTSTTGKIMRRQEGHTNVYRYNYWSSPVGSLAATSLTDNNTTSNNTNNTPFRPNMLKYGDASNAQFTSAFDEVGKISTRWLYTFENGTNYWYWNALNPTSTIQQGVGYIHKGTGNAGSQQQYIFEGKPNNGTILINAIDTGGVGSIANISKTEYLLGNPYPSAIDAHQFIDDNNGVIGGTLYIWEQWSGDSHYLDEYEGGYATLNKFAKVRAYKSMGIEGTIGTQDGTKTPTQFLPVGQGFIAEIVADGTIEFNNGQRIFKKESSGESVFFRGHQASRDEPETQDTADVNGGEFQIIKLEFKVSNNLSRELVLGFSETTSDAYDYGYDSRPNKFRDNDLTTTLNEEPYVIQAYSPITADKIIDLYFNATEDYSYSLEISELENIEPSQGIYLKDHQENITWDLRQGPYNFSALTGQDKDRFDIVFRGETLSNEEHELNEAIIFVNNTEDKLYVKGLTEQVASLTLTNMLGQRVKTIHNPERQTLEHGILLGELSTGVYLVNIKSGLSKEISKKVIIE